MHTVIRHHYGHGQFSVVITGLSNDGAHFQVYKQSKTKKGGTTLVADQHYLTEEAAIKAFHSWCGHYL